MVQCIKKFTIACRLGISFYKETWPEWTSPIGLIILWHLKMWYLIQKWAELSLLTIISLLIHPLSSSLFVHLAQIKSVSFQTRRQNQTDNPERERPWTQLGTGVPEERSEAEGAEENRSAQGNLAAAFNYIKGVMEKSEPCSSPGCMEVRHSHCKLQQGKTSSWQLRTWTGCLERLWKPNPSWRLD